jgi:hypothetical protein
LSPQNSRAGEWFLRSGIQEPNGGLARFYRADLERNQAVSTEITGYAVSVFVYLHVVTQDERYLERAAAAARFLTRTAWDARSGSMPFEITPAASTYFFDCGIVVRGLLAGWRATGEQEFLDVAAALGKSMTADFAADDGGFHPVLSLPGKRPVERDWSRWSQSAGCYQLKSAMAWWDLFEATGDAAFCEPYERVLENSLVTWSGFLPGHADRHKVMDRLHAFCYFLEGLLPRPQDARCAAAIRDGMARVAQLLGEIAPEFARSDVYAQLLRMRLYADWAGVVPLDCEAARAEARTLASFQATHDDRRIDGGYYFGRRAADWLPYVNPVSSAFACQALELWRARSNGGAQAHRHLLI